MNAIRTRNLAAALLLAASLESQGGVLAPELEEALKSSTPYEELPVIVSLADRIDPAAFAHEKNRHLRRATMIKALKARADLRQKPLRVHLEIRGARRMMHLWAINGMAITARPEVIRELANRPGIDNIRLDSVVQEPAVTYGTTALPEWNLNTIHAPDVWALGHTGAGVVIASMDTGVDPDHPDLAAKWRGGANSWFDPHGEHATPYDRQGHGTQTLGIIIGGSVGGTAIGVAPDARWIAVKLFNDAGQARLSDIHQGFQWLLDPDGNPDTQDAPDVVNNSWDIQDSAGQCITEFNADIQALKVAGIAVVFAPGNDGPAPASSNSPANNAAGFSAGAVDATLALANFSSRGPSACDGGIFPALAAPGVSVRTSDLSFGGLPLYATVSGTSYSAPHAAGALALLTGAYPAASVATLESALRQSAFDLGVTGADNGYGYGLIDALAAYNALGGAAPTNHPPTAASDTYSISAGGTLAAAAPGVLANDSDPDGNPLTAMLVTAPAGGTLTLDANGSFSYKPNSGTVSDSFAYQAFDGALASASATVSITVVQPNKPPVAVNDAAATRRNTAVAIAVLANDSDPDGSINPASVAIAAKPAKGTATVNTNGSVTYKPRLGFTGIDTFAYTVRDNLGAVSNKATVQISVTLK